MFPLDRQLLHLINGLAGSHQALFEGLLLLCGALPLVACVAVLLALWWTDPEGPAAAGPVLAAGLAPRREGLLASRRRCVMLALAVGASFICTRLIAFATRFPRPLGREELAVPMEADRWAALVDGMTGFGAFPSDHAALFFALAVGLFSWGARAGMAGLALAVLFSTARVAVGFHYPSDMVAGALLGGGLAGLAMSQAGRAAYALDGVVGLFARRPAVMYPLLFVVALDFTQHFRLVFKTIFYFLFTLLGG